MSWSEVRGVLLVLLGAIALFFYHSWWFFDGRLTEPALALAFVVSLVFSTVQLVGSWILYLGTHRGAQVQAGGDVSLTVDVFVTACGEELDLVNRTLEAACNMRGAHRTWLLDDGEDPRLAQLAEKLGAGYLTRSGNRHRKAGNINAGLARTDGDIVVVFDIDHVPRADFLERTLPHFADAEVGFVQVMLTFENQEDGWIAVAARESTLDFYNPTSLGAQGVGSATLVGSNALIRRDALESIGGYQPGLAEDLATSIALHAAGWRSVYVQEPLAPGLAPPDLASWYTQQLKWARGVFELLLTAYPRLVRRLSPGQRISYGVRMTYYWNGLVIAAHVALTTSVLWLGNEAYVQGYAEYLLHLLPLGVVAILIRQLALRRWRHPTLAETSAILQIRAIFLVLNTWPVYTAAWILAILRRPLGFRLTPKSAGNSLNPLWLAPHLGAIALLSWSVLKTIRTEELLTLPTLYWLPLALAIFLIASHVMLPLWWVVELLRRVRSARRGRSAEDAERPSLSESKSL